MKWFIRLIACMLLVMIGACFAVAQERISFVTSDSVTIIGDWYTNPVQSDGVLILLHMNRSNRSLWKPFAEKARSENFALLAIDFRGHGESIETASRTISFESLTNDDYADMVRDLEGAVNWVKSESEYKNLPVGIIGASIGANVALAYAVDDPQISVVILLSPGEDYRGILTLPAIKSYLDRPCLIISAEDDNYASVSSRKLAEAGGEGTELFQYGSGGHGTLLFESQADLSDRLIQYMKNNLKY